MATPSSVFTQLVSTTFNEHKSKTFDNVSNRNALYKFMSKKGNIVLEDGGASIVTPLEYAQNGTYQRFTDWDSLNISQSDVITSAQFPWCQIAINVVASGRELLINSGKNKIIDLAKAKMKNAIKTFANEFSSDLYSSGALPNQINGLQAIVADAGAGTVGGIDSSTWTFWKNEIFDLSAETVTLSSTTIEDDVLLPLWLTLDRGMGDCPDLIVMDNTSYAYFEASQTSLKRYTSSDKASGGFGELMYKRATVMHDGGSGIAASPHIYLLNTDYLKLHVHRHANLTEDKERVPVNQYGVVMPIFWMGNLVCTNRSQQGVVVA